jgi:Eukaryotic rRNA processing protein EBP2
VHSTTQIKDKLIFEQQKMDAFQQRKDRTEQRKYAKEVGAERAKEKAARKKDALAAVDQWRKDSKAKVNTALQLYSNTCSTRAMRMFAVCITCAVASQLYSKIVQASCASYCCT